MADELPIPSSDAPVTPEKPKTRISLSNDDLDAAGITDTAVGDTVTLTLTGRIVSDNQSEDSRDKSIEVDSIASASPTETPELSPEGEVSPEDETGEESETLDEGFPPVPPPSEDEEENPDEEKALGYKRKKKKGPPAPPVNMKRMMGGF